MILSWIGEQQRIAALCFINISDFLESENFFTYLCLDIFIDMPSSTTKQANTAKLAGAVKAGKFPKSKAGPAVKSMAKMPMKTLKHFMKVKESMTEDQKKRLLTALKSLKETFGNPLSQTTGNVGGETDIVNADNLVAEDVPEATERNVVAKTFDTEGDFDSYVNQHRGIEMTSKEQQAVLGYKNAKPTQQDKFFVKYETTDAFGTNDTTVIKKLKEGNQFCWTAFSKHQNSEDEGKPEGAEGEDHEQTPEPKEGGPEEKGGGLTEQDDSSVTVNDKIRITKTITFLNDIEGAGVLGDFLRVLEV